MNWLPTPEEIDEALRTWKTVEPVFSVYVLWDGGRSYYVGATASYSKRLDQHRRGEGSKTTKSWIAAGRSVNEYWRIDVPRSKCSWSFCGTRKHCALPKLEDLERLVLNTLRRQNPRCI